MSAVTSITKEGFLTKKAMTLLKDNWKKRYFRLKDGALSYYDDLKAKTAKGTLVITPDTRVREIAGGWHRGRPHELEVYFPTSEEALYAVADDYDDIIGPEGWVAKIQAVIDALQPPPSLNELAVLQKKKSEAAMASAAAASAASADNASRKGRIDDLRAADDERKKGLLQKGPPDVTAMLAATAELRAKSPSTMYVWGAGDMGTIGDGKVTQDGAVKPVVNAALKKELAAVEVSAGTSHVAALTARGQLFVWGSGADGQLGGGLQQATKPTLVAFFKDKRVFSVACGDVHTLAVAEGGSLWAWGVGREGQLGLGEMIKFSADPKQVVDVGTSSTTAVVNKVYAGRYTSGAINSKGQALLWGSSGEYGRMGFGPSWARADAVAWKPTEVPVVAADGFVTHSIVCGDVYTAFLVTIGATKKIPGALFIAGALGVSAADFTSRKDFLTYPHVTGLFGDAHVVTAIAGGVEHLICVADGSVYTMGRGYLGGTANDLSDEPVAVGQLDNEDIVEVAAGAEFSVARTRGGRLYAWGQGEAGQMGCGSYAAATRPIVSAQVSGSHYDAVVCGADFVVGLAFPGEPPAAAPAARSAAESALAAALAASEADNAVPGAKERRNAGLLQKRQSWRTKTSEAAAQFGVPAAAAVAAAAAPAAEPVPVAQSVTETVAETAAVPATETVVETAAVPAAETVVETAAVPAAETAPTEASAGSTPRKMSAPEALPAAPALPTTAAPPLRKMSAPSTPAPPAAPSTTPTRPPGGPPLPPRSPAPSMSPLGPPTHPGPPGPPGPPTSPVQPPGPPAPPAAPTSPASSAPAADAEGSGTTAKDRVAEIKAAKLAARAEADKKKVKVATQEAAASDWVQEKDEETGLVKYFNASTGERRSFPPPGFKRS